MSQGQTPRAAAELVNKSEVVCNHIDLLHYVVEHPEEIWQNKVAVDATKYKGTLTGVLDRMESRVLITRRSDADDARRTYIALTRKGHILFADVFPAHLAHLQRAFGRLSASELGHLQTGLSTLREAFEKEHAR